MSIISLIIKSRFWGNVWLENTVCSFEEHHTQGCHEEDGSATVFIKTTTVDTRFRKV